jgi:hypothetical protein
MPVRDSGPYPRLALESLKGGLRPLETVWAGGGALILHGHRNCKTTRQTLPFVDRIHRRKGKGTVLAVLQDDRETAYALLREQALDLPVLLEGDPYPLAAALSLEVVPTLFFVGSDGRIEKTVQAFDRAELEGFARRLGVEGPLFVPEDNAPATKPG